jgi:pyruvate-formate lyase-activating enzyme
MNILDMPTKFRRVLSHWEEHAPELRQDTERRGGKPPKLRFPPQRWARDDYVQRVMTERWGERYTQYREMFQRALRMEVVPDYPIYMDFDLKDTCNLACPACTDNHRPWTREELDLDAVFRDPLFSDFNLPSANVGNAAEPFLAPEQTMRLVRFLRERQVMDIFLHTNGTLLTPELIEDLIHNGPTWLTVSIDAATEETYRKVRGKGFQKVMDNVHQLLERRNAAGSPFPFIRTSFIVVPEAIHEMYDFHEYWKPHVEMVEFQDYVAPNPIGITLDPYVVESDLYELMPPENCPQPFYRMHVTAGGGVGPCCSSFVRLDELRLGFPGEQTFTEMWRSEKVNAIRAEHRRADGPNGIKTCSQCIRQNYRFKHYHRDFR